MPAQYSITDLLRQTWAMTLAGDQDKVLPSDWIEHPVQGLVMMDKTKRYYCYRCVDVSSLYTRRLHGMYFQDKHKWLDTTTTTTTTTTTGEFF